MQAHKWLIKAYYENGQINQAIALCQQLLLNEHEQTRRWARKLLFTDDIDASVTAENPTKSKVQLQSPSETLPEDPEPAIEKFIPKTLKEFKVFCQTNLLSELKVFESLRKQVLISIFTTHLLFLYLIIALLKFFPVVSSFLKNSMYFQIGSSIISIPFLFIFFLFYYLLVFFLLFGIWIFFYAAAFETFSTGFKYKMSEQILSYVNPNKNLKYVRNSSEEDIKNSLEFFQNSQLFQGIIIPNKIVQDDYIHGRINGVDICFSNICAELELKHYWNNYLNITFFINLINAPIRISYFLSFLLPFTFYICFVIVRLIKLIPYIFKNILCGEAVESKRIESEVLKNEVTRTSLIFKGLFFKAKYNKNSRAVTIVQPKLINANTHALNHAKKQLIKLEDPEFAKFFTVYSDDQIEARYVLYTNFMDKIVNFRKKTNRNIYISFVDDMIYIAIEEAVENNILDPNLYKSVLKFAPLREYFETLNLMLGIVEDLNLDRHI
ncbi:MAG: DUF3137 domain-containing protein [Nostoc sp.]|uniref:DUF3137 domain-containing protein n=1 Tax=Nostoc sp. TaxID=1180 RepID=UPI002FFB0333